MKIKILTIMFFPLILFSQTKTNIDEVIRIAVENNLKVKSSRLNVEKENAVKLKSFNIPKPQLFVEYEGVDGSLSNALERKIGITQEIEFPTNYFLRSDVQSSQVLASREELNNSINNLKTEVKLNYYRLLLLNELLENSKLNLKIYEDFLFTAEKKYEAGSTSSLEVLGAKVNKIKFENEIKNLESEIKTIQSEMRNLMNVDYDIVPAEDLIFKELTLSKTILIKNAVDNNPELKMLTYQKEKFSNKLSLSKGELLPDISFSYFRQKLGSNDDYWGMEIGLGIPLWFWWEPSGKIEESSYEFQIASSEETNLKNSLENEVIKSFEDYENSLRQVKFFNEEAIKETEEILRQSKISYDEGAIGYVEYLSALDMVYETKTQYLNVVYKYYQSLITLENLTAGELK